MPINLDNRNEVKTLDSQNMLGSIESIAKQVEEVLGQAGSFTFPASYKTVKNIVFLGMGGSTLGAHSIKSVYASSLTVPFEIVNGYMPPAYVGKQTLAVVVSYSGTTAESVSALQAAKKKGAKVVVVTSGGDLATLAKKFKFPALVFTTKNNPCGSPRMGLGYTNFGPLALLGKLGLVKVSSGDFKKVISTLITYSKQFGVESSSGENKAKQAATALLGRTVWYIGAEHLAGSAHVAANQMNENAKRFGGWFPIPEMNHHLMEGLAFPTTNTSNLVMVLLSSALYDARVAKRFGVTKEILQKNNLQYVEYALQSASTIEQVAESLVFSSYVSFYSALLEGIDPTAIPNVDYFKAALKQ